MTVRSIGAGTLTALMRAERIRDLDSSWLLFGPSDEVVDVAEEEPEIPFAWRFAAE